MRGCALRTNMQPARGVHLNVQHAQYMHIARHVERVHTDVACETCLQVWSSQACAQLCDIIQSIRTCANMHGYRHATNASVKYVHV